VHICIVSRRICILDDDTAFLQDIVRELHGAFDVVVASSITNFRKIFMPNHFDLVVLDMRLDKDKEGLEILREVHRLDPFQQVVVATAYADTETYLDAIQAGALLYLDKKRLDPSALAMLFDAVIQQGELRRTCAASARALERMDPLDLIGSSEEARRLRAEIDRLSRNGQLPSLVVVCGEVGSGRELVARNLHARFKSASSRPIVVFSSQGLPAIDCLNEIFGTGSSGFAKGRRGLLEEAQGSALLLRAADALPNVVLEKIADVAARRSFSRVGGNFVRPLDAMIFLIGRDGEPFQKIFGKTSFETIEVAPLRERKEDIPLLASYFLDSLRRRGRESPRVFGSDVSNALLGHRWPGNVAELKSTLEYSALRATAGGEDVIQLHHMPFLDPRSETFPDQSSGHQWDMEYQEARIQVALADRAIRELATSNRTKLAKLLCVETPTTLSRRIERCLKRFPTLATEFPKAAEVFASVPRDRISLRPA
jgi:DNA-binding NtrC family response regulator